MKYQKLFAVLAMGLLPLLAECKELITNRDFSKAVNGIPAGWSFRTNPTKPQFKLVPAKGKEPAYITVKTTSKNGRASIQFAKRVKIPAGAKITLSGEYRTGTIVFGKGGSVFVSSQYRHKANNSSQPSFWINANLKPSDKWTKFSVTQRARYDVESFSVNASNWVCQGEVSWRNFSLKVEMPSNKPDANGTFAWREAENLEKIQPCNNWGANISADYFSGKGGVAFKEGKKLVWNFQIPPVTDPVTLFSKPRTWYLWARVYGYLGSPRIMIYRNDRFMSFVDTPANEKTNKKGEYAGPGTYTWVLCGKFTTTGGAQRIELSPKKRMFVDALLLTDDSKYAPVKYEARSMKQAPFQDITTTNMIKAEYVNEGISDTITLPISFRIGGKNKIIPNNQKPGIFHFSLPDYVKVEGVTSHWAGTDWNRPSRWGKKFLTWKKTGSRVAGGKKFNDYQAELYFLSGNQYLVFVKADKKAFRKYKDSLCEYYLESNGEKQMKESIVLKHVAIKPAKPFKRIYVGPSYVPFYMMYRSYPNVFTNMKAAGLNYMGCWFEPWTDKDFFAGFRDKAYANNFMITVVVEQYRGFTKKHIATGIDGKQLLNGVSGHGTKILSLAMDENDEPIRGTLERTRLAAATGVTVEYDDEMTNVLWDIIDYSPEVKALFREWLEKNRKGVAYKDPVEIVRNKKTDRKMYDHWVDFKCSRLAYWYSLYRKAFDEGLAQFKGKYPAHLKPRLLTCIQGPLYLPDGTPCTAETVKESNYLDYRLINKYCDLIQMMSYTYKGVRESATPGDKMELYNNYLGKNNTVPILLAGGYGTETSPEDKVMLKYQVWDTLMQKPKLIIFYAGATLFNAPTLAPVTEAIRVAGPYEDFFVDGKKYTAVKGGKPYLRLKALSLGKKVLLYAANYANPVGRQESVTFPTAPKKVIECSTGKSVPVKGKGFSFNFKSDRGKLFLVEF